MYKTVFTAIFFHFYRILYVVSKINIIKTCGLFVVERHFY